MLIEHEGVGPRVAGSATSRPTCSAAMSGAGEEARILFGAVLTAEGGSIEVGARSIVMENALVRGRGGYPARLGEHVLVGPHAHVNGATIEEEVFLATGVSVFPGATVGRGSEVRVGAVVHVNSTWPPARPFQSAGRRRGPAELFSPRPPRELWAIQERMDFPGTVFGMSREEATMERVTRRYSESFGRHRGDRVLRTWEP